MADLEPRVTSRTIGSADPTVRDTTSPSAADPGEVTLGGLCVGVVLDVGLWADWGSVCHSDTYPRD